LIKRVLFTRPDSLAESGIGIIQSMSADRANGSGSQAAPAPRSLVEAEAASARTAAVAINGKLNKIFGKLGEDFRALAAVNRPACVRNELQKKVRWDTCFVIPRSSSKAQRQIQATLCKGKGEGKQATLCKGKGEGKQDASLDELLSTASLANLSIVEDICKASYGGRLRPEVPVERQTEAVRTIQAFVRARATERLRRFIPALLTFQAFVQARAAERMRAAVRIQAFQRGLRAREACRQEAAERMRRYTAAVRARIAFPLLLWMWRFPLRCRQLVTAGAALPAGEPRTRYEEQRWKNVWWWQLDLEGEYLRGGAIVPPVVRKWISEEARRAWVDVEGRLYPCAAVMLAVLLAIHAVYDRLGARRAFALEEAQDVWLACVMEAKSEAFCPATSATKAARTWLRFLGFNAADEHVARYSYSAMRLLQYVA